MQRIIRIIAALGLALSLQQPAASAPPASGKLAEPAVSRLIVKFRASTGKSAPAADAAERVAAMAVRTGVGMNVVRELSGGAHLVTTSHAMAPAELETMARTLSGWPEVEYAEPDARRYTMLLPNDPRFAGQHYLLSSTVERAAINAPTAWDITTGSAGTTVAVIDTGIRPEHIDIAGRLAPGYDFISADPDGGFFTADDGDGRDPNPADPGDGSAAGECGPRCPPFNLPSGWHGTRVASLIGAVTNNGQGIAGVDWNTRILPVRALGKAGRGFASDIIDAARWAAGLPVPGIPQNPNPARIINLSLGGPGTCMASEQAAVDDIIATGALVVVAAGNEATNALRSSPASCKGVLPVAASARDGALASFSNFGVKVGLIAPGVDLLSAANRGTQSPVPNGDTYSTISGTSFSAPLAAGAASLMLSLNDSLTPQQLIATLRASARPFPVPAAGQRCGDPLCGAGFLNAAAAVRAVAAGNIAPVSADGDGLRAAFAAATPLTPGVSRNGALLGPYPFDVYRLSLPAGGSLSVATSGGTDTYGYLFDASGKLLDQVDDSVPPRSPTDPRANLNFRIDSRLNAGTYYVAVEGFSNSTAGSYALNARLSSQSSGDGGGGAADILLCVMLLTGLSGAWCQHGRARQQPSAC